MDSEITESEKKAEEIEVVVTPAEEADDGKEVTRKVKASFKLGSQLPRHTRSDKVFSNLYDESKPIVMVQPGALWANESKMNTWTLTNDGPRLAVLGHFESFEKAVLKEFSITKAINKQGYRYYPMQSYPTKNWLVMRRYKPQNVSDNETLAANIIYFAQRKIKLQEHDFGKEIKQKTRPLQKPQDRPKNIMEIYPKCLDESTKVNNEIMEQSETILKQYKKSLPRKQYLKKKSKLKKQRYRQLKSNIHYIPKKVRVHDQKFAAIAWLTTPKYFTLDEDTKYYNRKALDENDAVPDKVFTENDFDEAMIVNVLRTFSSEYDCIEYIDNKAKHDLEYCNVTCIETYSSCPLDMMITKEFEKVERTYHTEFQQQVIVDKKKMTQAAIETAKNNPDMVNELTVENGKTVLKESRATKAIAKELEAEKEKTDKLFEETMAKLKILDVDENVENNNDDVEIEVVETVHGGASKDDTITQSIEDELD